MFSKLLNKCNKIYVGWFKWLGFLFRLAYSLRYHAHFFCNQGNELMNEHFGLVSINDKPSAIDRKWCSFSLSCVPHCSLTCSPVASCWRSVAIAKYCFHCLVEMFVVSFSLSLSVDQDYPYMYVPLSE